MASTNCATSRSDAALSLAKLGFRVFPLSPESKTPLAGSKGFKDATTDLDQVRKWWGPGCEDRNIAIATEGLVVIDVDGKDNPWPTESLLRNDLNGIPCSLTPKGKHYLFKTPIGKSWKNSVSQIAENVDVRANGGYIVAPGSEVNGVEYKWADGLNFTTPVDELPTPPFWLIELLDETSSGDRSDSSPVTSPGEGNIIPEGRRNIGLTEIGGAIRRPGMSLEAIEAALKAENKIRCKPPLPEEEVRRVAKSVFKYKPDPKTVDEIKRRCQQIAEDTESQRIEDPGAFPEELMNVPGFIGDVMAYSLRNAPHPNKVASFAGAIAMLSLLTGRKVQGAGGTRTNLYILMLGMSGVGKDYPRKTNSKIAHESKISEKLALNIGSAEGLEDNLFVRPALLFQTDEIDSFIRNMAVDRDQSIYGRILSRLMQLYTSADSEWVLRVKAGNDAQPLVIHQPHVVIFGTATPNCYYEALNPKMLTNGFFSRTITFESYPRERFNPKSEKPVPMPESIIQQARFWNDLNPDGGNLSKPYPTPKIIPIVREASEYKSQIADRVFDEGQKYETAGDDVGMTVFSRIVENIDKLALIYACSENHLEPSVSIKAVEWAEKVVLHLARRSLFQAKQFVSSSAFDERCLKVIRKIRNSKNQICSRSSLLRGVRDIKAKELDEIIDTLSQRGEVRETEGPTVGTYYTTQRGQK